MAINNGDLIAIWADHKNVMGEMLMMFRVGILREGRYIYMEDNFTSATDAFKSACFILTGEGEGFKTQGEKAT
jgi:hypothetical protein